MNPMLTFNSISQFRLAALFVAIAFTLGGITEVSAQELPKPEAESEMAEKSGKSRKGGGGKKGKGKGKRSRDSDQEKESEPEEKTMEEVVNPVQPDSEFSHVSDPEGLAFFDTKIRPALIKYCYECHSEMEGKSKGGLLVDSKRALAIGGDSGPAIVSGDLENSLFITAVRYHDPDYEMPPKGKLPEQVIADFEKWIATGAPDPRVEEGPNETPVKSEIDIEAGRKFWSFTPVEKPALPAVKNAEWPQSDIDHFILASLEKNALTPAPKARPETLVRRLYFVLCGLPPSPDDVMKWGRAIGPDLNQDAIEQLVDSLLTSPRFGERWGQHWLDVARYADSTGGDSNNIFPDAWRYRNYVISAFNDDKPFDHFILEQLAGDLLPADSETAEAENIVATGFLAIGQKLVGEMDERKFQADLIDEQIDATTRAFLGITAACARCHDHKTDPIPQSDYYALASFFQKTQTHYGLLDAQARQSSTLFDTTGMGLPVGRDVLTDDEFNQLKAEYEEAEAAMESVRQGIRSKDEDISRAKLRRSRTAIDRAEAALKSYDENGHPRTLVMAVQDRDEPVQTRLLIRGEVDKPGPVVDAGFLQVAAQHQPTITNGSGRHELANWIANAENPLTARVMANRMWHWLFGQGLVRSVDDFGATGEAPSHPELLDFLATRLVENKWSLKKSIREIVLSRTWQQAATHHLENFERDPDNRFLWRASQRRLEAEAIRDALLTISGNLETGPPRTPLLDVVGEGTVGQNVYEPEIRKIAANVRSIYLPRVRNVLPESLALFDAPDASNVTGARDTTTVPLQALYAMNHEFVRTQAEAFATSVLEESANEQVQFAYLKAFGRFPTDRERQVAGYFMQQMRSAESTSKIDPLVAYCHALLCVAEFGVID